jgi:hypothetical protein
MLEEEKTSLISVIEWYRDEYHKKDSGHTEMIEEIKQITNIGDLEPYWQQIDNWLDY